MMLRRALWLPVNAVQSVFVALWTAGWIVAALLVLVVTRRPRLALAMARRLWAPGILAISGVRWERRGGEGVDFERPHYFVSNHASFLDIPVLFVALPAPLYFVAKAELARIPFLGWYMSALGMVFVDRGTRAAGTQMTRPAVEILRRGGSVVTFPSGSRERDGARLPFKRGGFAVPIDAGVPVVPVAIEGTGRCLPPGGMSFRPGAVRVTVGEPIATTGLDRGERGELSERAETAVRALRESPS